MIERKNNAVAAPADRSLTLTRIFDAPPHLVFEAWTKKEHIDRWLAPHGFTIPYSDGDFRVGGTWHCCMVAPDGTEHRVSGVYREIIPDKLLVFSHAWEEADGSSRHETVVTVRFDEEGGKTKLTLEQSIFKSIESRDGHIGGWSQSLERLAELLPQLKNQQ